MTAYIHGAVLHNHQFCKYVINRYVRELLPDYAASIYPKLPYVTNRQRYINRIIRTYRDVLEIVYINLQLQEIV